MRLKMRHQKRLSIDDINTSYNPISLDHIFEDVDPLLEWLHEKKNPLLDRENAGVLPVDTSDDEMNIDQSQDTQQQNLSHSSSSATPTQSGDGPDDGGLSPIDDDDDDRQSGDRGEIRSSSWCEGDYGVGTLVGTFVINQNSMEIWILHLGEIEVNLELHQEKKAPKSILLKFLLPAEDRVLVTLGIVIHLLALKVFICRDNLHIFNLHMVIIHHFLIMVCRISHKYTLRHQCITHIHLTCTLLLKYILHLNYLKIKVKMLLFGYIFGQRPRESSQDRSEGTGEGSDLPRHSTNW
ncbi:hypothetical protein HRI_004898300 [Hibiscus trionum]|uniref:Uncharacterized protein n=1 Tax=Hibiscus trionum TaxID=183268 RepID=A0A9W7JBG4_HIBTR|nr:hypothetical protein HRI_004898300 [Hibiscus trionum]